MNAVQITFGKEMKTQMKITQEGSMGALTKETVVACYQPDVPQKTGPKPEEVARKSPWNFTRPGHAARKSK